MIQGPTGALSLTHPRPEWAQRHLGGCRAWGWTPGRAGIPPHPTGRDPAGGPQGPFPPLSPGVGGSVPSSLEELSLWFTFLIKARD